MPQSDARPSRSEIVTTDPDRARSVIDQLFNVRLRVRAPQDQTWHLRVEHLDAGTFTADDVTLPGNIGYLVEGRDEVVVSTVVSGEVEAERGGVVDRYRAQDVYLGNVPDDEYTAETRDLRALTVNLPLRLLDDVAGITAERPLRTWRFEDLRAGEAASRHWRNAYRFVVGLANDPTTATPLVLGSAARLLAATTLTVFPNTAVAGTDRRDTTAGHDSHPATLRRAVAFIDEHADRDIGLSEVTAATYVTPRALQLSFRRHLDTTPGAYIRHVRLERAHEELCRADPERDTVTAIAARWGFHSAGRFAAAYREVYGRLPSETLRDDAPG
ncbi:MAG: AraC family transcriptional regulator [Pseudonocardiaceae bacterium]|nr:MAG: AraC family transcriptional regulator [Pseudonocardiaceae bacterium]